MKFGCSIGIILLSSDLQIWYVVVRISQSDSEGPFDVETTRVDCIYFKIHTERRGQTENGTEATLANKTMHLDQA